MRKAGVLLHISSLPGAFGYGTFGASAYDFADRLADCGFTIWQVLPFNIPCGTGCPYSSASTFFGNPLFLDPEILAQKGYLTADEVEGAKCEGVLYATLFERRMKLLRRAAARAEASGIGEAVQRFWEANPRVAEGCRFLARRDAVGGKPWRLWEEGVTEREEDLRFYAFLQYEFFEQWKPLHTYIRAKGIEVIGDIPIYCDYESSEVCFNRDCFRLSDNLPSFVSGVPADDFSADGQKWGHPLYDTERLAEKQYALLYDRFAYSAMLYDVTRIDHFQALVSYYAIPHDSGPLTGHWEAGVGRPFMERLHEGIGGPRFIAEDFGLYGEAAHEMASSYGIPDMRILQFTLSHGQSPDSYGEHSVVYTGTHDNDTFCGYLDAMTEEQKQAVAALIGASDTDCESLTEAAIGALLSCRAERVVFPLQDLLMQGTEARMNVPGIAEGNWSYRASTQDMTKFQAMSGAIRFALARTGRIQEA